MYITRHAEDTIRKLSKMFGAVLVTGPRQVGKTTILEHIAEVTHYVTLDDPLIRTSAIEQSGTFFKDNPPPVFIYEIQYATNLFPQIKMILDKSKQKGQFFMKGSQQFALMENVTESLAGRLGLLMLLGFSLRERKGIHFTDPFLPTDEYFSARKENLAEIEYNEVWNIIHRGSMPELSLNDDSGLFVKDVFQTRKNLYNIAKNKATVPYFMGDIYIVYSSCCIIRFYVLLEYFPRCRLNTTWR